MPTYMDFPNIQPPQGMVKVPYTERMGDVDLIFW